jgi:lysozyme
MQLIPIGLCGSPKPRGRFSIWFGAILSLFVILAPEASFAKDQAFPPGAPEGVDVTSLDGPIDWSAVAGSGIEFAIARASDGLFVDNRFQQNFQGIADAGLIRGPVQFFEPRQDAAAQAALFLSQIGLQKPRDLLLTLDVETFGGQTPFAVISGVKTWTDVVRTATGVNPIIYTGRFFGAP